MKEFAKNLQSYNKQVLLQQKKLPSSSESSDIEVSKKKLSSKREKALEFAKHVPKPKVDTKKIKEQSSPLGIEIIDDNYMLKGDQYGMDYGEICKIQSLEAQHDEKKKQVEAIKRSLGMK